MTIKWVTEGGVGDRPGKDVEEKHGRQSEPDGKKWWGGRRDNISSSKRNVRLDLVSKKEGDKRCDGRCVWGAGDSYLVGLGTQS